MPKITRATNAIVNVQQEIFLQAYLANGRNRELAEDEAGYSRGYGKSVLTKPNCRKRLAEIMQEASSKLKVSQELVLSEIAAIAFADITDLSEIGEIKSLQDLRRLPKAVRKAIHTIDFDREVIPATYDEGGKLLEPARIVTVIKRIRMHPKTSSLAILAEATDLIQTEREKDLEKRPAFTGMTLIRHQGGES